MATLSNRDYEGFNSYNFGFSQSVNPVFLEGSDLDNYVQNIFDSTAYIVLRGIKTRNRHMRNELGHAHFKIKNKYVVLELFRHNRARKLKELGFTDSEVITLMGMRNANELGYFLNSTIEAI